MKKYPTQLKGNWLELDMSSLFSVWDNTNKKQ